MHRVTKNVTVVQRIFKKQINLHEHPIYQFRKKKKNLRNTNLEKKI